MGRVSQEGPFLLEYLWKFTLVMLLFLPRAFQMLLGSILLVFTKEQQACNLASSDSTEEENSSEQTLWIL